jgi:hypothetical protein
MPTNLSQWGAIPRALREGMAAYQEAKKAAQQEALLEQQRAEQKAGMESKLAVDAEERAKADKQREFQNKLAMEELGLKRRALDQKGGGLQGGAGMGMTPGRKAADVSFGKEYADWSGGGFAQAQKGLEALQTARQSIAPTDSVTGQPRVRQDISGGIRGKLPDFVRSITNPEAVSAKETIRGAVMSTLRATLGSAFTEKEGERIFNMAYNDELPAEENLRRLERTYKELESAAKAKQSMADYFEQQGTLTGWQGRMPAIGQDEDPEMAEYMALKAKAGR